MTIPSSRENAFMRLIISQPGRYHRIAAPLRLSERYRPDPPSDDKDLDQRSDLWALGLGDPSPGGEAELAKVSGLPLRYPPFLNGPHLGCELLDEVAVVQDCQHGPLEAFECLLKAKP